MDAKFICPIHGEQTMTLDNLIRGHKCKDCSYEYRADVMRHNINYVENCIESIKGNKWLNKEEYRNATVRNLRIQCCCGNVFTTSLVNYKDHGVNTCFSCSCKMSSGEKRIRDFLELNKINFIKEKRFEDCRDIKPLPFDFYLPESNLIIEFDGQQHFEETYYMDYETTKKHDVIKNQYREDNNIDILRTPYWEGNNIEDIIATKLNLQVKDIVSSHMKV